MPAPASTRRRERRFAISIRVELFRRGDSPVSEKTVTENVSSRGARVFTERARNPGELVQITLADDGVKRRSRVAYCQRLQSRRFAIGLELFSPVEQWGGTAAALNG